MVVASAEDEVVRLESLRCLHILDTPKEEEFDEVVRLAAAICGTPMSMVSLIDENRQWFKAAVGLPVSETPRDISFCSHAIAEEGMFIIPDALQDMRFAKNPFVVGDPSIRFYAGMPIESPAGFAIGTLCVVDVIPRTLRADQIEALRVLARQVQARMELRAQKEELERALHERDAMARVLLEKEELFRLFMDNGPYCGYIKDARGRFMFYNKQVSKCFGVDGDAWLGKTDAEVFPDAEADAFREHDEQVLAAGVPLEFAEETLDKDGNRVHWKSIKFPYWDGNGNRMLAGVSLDVTAETRQKLELERANAMLRALSTTDSLTGLKNRRAFDERLEIEFTMAKRKARNLSVLLIDVDNFKARNDEFGHAAGDTVLRALGEILRKVVRSTDTAARYGGEEFVVILPDTDIPRGMYLVERIRTAVAAWEWEGVPVTMSMGISGMTIDVMSPEQMVRAADKALYAAKGAGKDCIRTSDSTAVAAKPEPPTAAHVESAQRWPLMFLDAFGKR